MEAERLICGRSIEVVGYEMAVSKDQICIACHRRLHQDNGYPVELAGKGWAVPRYKAPKTAETAKQCFICSKTFVGELNGEYHIGMWTRLGPVGFFTSNTHQVWCSRCDAMGKRPKTTGEKIITIFGTDWRTKEVTHECRSCKATFYGEGD